MMAKDEYVGRLQCDGNGNLLADESRNAGSTTVAVHDANGEPVEDADGNQVTVTVPLVRYGKNHGRPVAHDTKTDKFFFIEAGEPSHNERHHKQNVDLVGTQDQVPEDPGYAGTKDKPTKGNEHHFGVLEDDPHYAKGATDSQSRVTNTKLKFDADKAAAKASSHTHQHKGGE